MHAYTSRPSVTGPSSVSSWSGKTCRPCKTELQSPPTQESQVCKGLTMLLRVMLQAFAIERLHWFLRQLSLHQMILTQRHHCSQNAAVGSQLPCSYIHIVNVLKVSIYKIYCHHDEIGLHRLEQSQQSQ